MFRVNNTGYNKIKGRDTPEGGRLFWTIKKQRNL